jgi:glycosyltransferase involved in cell wall biosynthesis
MLGLHSSTGALQQRIAAYIALTEFARAKFVASGLPPDRIWVKPNFLSKTPPPSPSPGDYALFAGRLSPEKGVRTLLDAWSCNHKDLPPLQIIGDGPAAAEVRRAATNHPDRIQWLGALPHDDVLRRLTSAAMLVFPSLCYETFGLTIVEALASGTPIIASDHGAPREIVTHGKEGLLFPPGDHTSLAAQARLLASSPQLHRSMRIHAIATYAERFTADINYSKLMAIYEAVLSA